MVAARVEGGGEDTPGYLSRQLVTYLGNKRALLAPIGAAVDGIVARVGRRLRILDLFSGSGVVSRRLKPYASRLVSNDLETYAGVLGRCFLANRSEVDLAQLRRTVASLNRRITSERGPPGFIRELYAPRDETDIQPGERVFYTVDNARRLDAYRRWIGELDPALQDLLLGPLLGRASVHANTAGVFKGFYKDRRTGLGRYGGSGADALSRIRGTIELEVPILSRFECEVEVLEEDASELARRRGGFDVAYVDPPYNQHPYGSNYFMLNLLAGYRRPAEVSRVSGIPADWTRSGFNSRASAPALLARLFDDLDAPFLVVSFNDEGFVSVAELRAMLERQGRVEAIEVRHPAFRGSRNFDRRPVHVTEHVFVVERG